MIRLWRFLKGVVPRALKRRARARPLLRAPDGTCEHERFEVEAVVERVWSGDREGEGDLALHSTIKVRCADCRVRFGVPGLPAGLLWDRPTTDPTGLELRAPLRPDGHLTSMMADLPGFEMRMGGEALPPDDPRP